MTPPDDVVIAGAGPAGPSLAAGLLARRACACALVDRATLPAAESCAATRSTPARWRCCAHLGLARACRRPARQLDGHGRHRDRRRVHARRLRRGVSGLRASRARDSMPRWSTQAVRPARRCAAGVSVVEPLLDASRRTATVRGVPCSTSTAAASASRAPRDDCRRRAPLARWRIASGLARHPDASAALGRRRLLREVSSGLGRRSARCTSAAGTTSAWRPCRAGSPTSVSSAARRAALRTMPADAAVARRARQTLAARALRGRAARVGRHGARAARRRRVGQRACRACCSPATPPASSIR